jgi:glycosyl transferase family 25
MIWPVYVINMASNTARMAHAAAELDRLHIPFTRFDAVNGRALSPEELAQVYDPKANLRRARHPMIGPEIGCYLSHHAVWEKIAAGDAPGGIILEDDFAAADDLAAVLKALAQDEGGWEVAKLFSARMGQKVLHPRALTTGREMAVPYKVPNTTLGYAIRRDAAAHLAATVLPVSRPIDEDQKHFWEHGLRIEMVTPPPLSFSIDSAEAGTITAARRAKVKRSTGAAVRQAWRSMRFRLRYLFNLHWHRVVRRAG